MFRNQMKKVLVEEPVITVNNYNDKITAYSAIGYSDIAIAESGVSKYQSNDLDVINVEWLGLTKDKTIQKGYRIAQKYLVDYVEVFRLYSILHLLEIDNDGRLQNSVR